MIARHLFPDLVVESKRRDASLFKVKKGFTEVTRQQVSEFLDTSVKFRQTYETSGPGNADLDLDEGLEVRTS